MITSTAEPAESDAETDVELEALLGEPIQQAKQRAQLAFDEEIRRCGGKVVLFGAGNMGRQVLARLKQDGITPLAFSDNSKNAHGKMVDGLLVLTPEDAAKRHGREAAFIVTIYNRDHDFADTRRQLRKLGCTQVVPVIPMRWKYHETFLPYYRDDLPHKVLEQADEIRNAMTLWADETSRREFVAQVRWRLHGDFDLLSPPSTAPQYFPPEIFRLTTEEVFVDVGAYDGDTIRDFLSLQGGRFHQILALEPDPDNFRKLSRYVETLPAGLKGRIQAKPLAVGAENGCLRFRSGCGEGSSLSGQGTMEVRCMRLDDLLIAADPTYIKMDIEGAELDALSGARNILRQQEPVVAACVYHAQDHLWRIPLALREINPNYALFLRPHRSECWDTVCYAVPPERLFSTSPLINENHAITGQTI
jgi:FkbM family methyltransferase